MMIILDVIFMALIATTIVGFLTWSLLTQHRDYGCGAIRLRRRLRISVKFAVPETTELIREGFVAPHA